MTQPWTAEFEIAPAQAQTLIETQFGELAPARVELLGTGWDNSAFLVNGEFVFRFPRREIAGRLLAVESRLLPFVAPRLPLAVPLPRFLGQPGEGFPWPFCGYRWLPGRTACAAALNESQRTSAAEPLARFLAALHAIPVEEAQRHGAGADEFNRLNLADRRPRVRERLADLSRRGLIGDIRTWDHVFDAPEMPPAESRQVLVHGDLYVRHLLVDAEGRPTGVIDWGDVHVNSPALDLSLAHSFLPASVHDAFRRAYGPIDDATWQLARFRALDVAVVLLTFGHATGQPDLVREGEWTFRQLAEVVETL